VLATICARISAGIRFKFSAVANFCSGVRNVPKNGLAMRIATTRSADMDDLESSLLFGDREDLMLSDRSGIPLINAFILGSHLISGTP